MPNSANVTNAGCIHEACHSKIFGNFSDFFLAYFYVFATLSSIVMDDDNPSDIFLFR